MSSDNVYMREYMRKYSAQRRLNLIYYLGGKCKNCGSTEKLEIDHIDPKTKDFTLGSRWHRMSKLNNEELKKCQVLCQSCHIEKTVKERGYKLAKGTHGTLSSYRYCKCDLCRKAKSDWMKEYKKRTRSSVVVAPNS